MDVSFQPSFPHQLKDSEEVFELPAESLASYVDLQIEPDSNLVGNRWLTRDGSAFIVAPSHHGKSSLCVALMINFAIGRVVFGFKPVRPLRVLLVESEDDQADMKLFTQVVRVMHLTELERTRLAQNTKPVYVRSISGSRFFKALEQYLANWPADILLINPLTGFYTGSVLDDEAINEFLRIRLNPLMEKHHCAPVIAAHMPKNVISQLADKAWYEWMYTMSGCAALTNWARAMLVFSPTKLQGTYRFVIAKRFRESGWSEAECYFSHQSTSLQLNGSVHEIIQWVPSTDSQIALAMPDKPLKRKPRGQFGPEEVWTKMSPLTEYSRPAWRVWCKEDFNIGSNQADDIRQFLIDNGRIQVIEGQGKGAAKSRTYKKCLDHSNA